MTTQSDSAAWWAERERKAREYEEAESERHFAAPDWTIPDLCFDTPDCPICTRNTDYEDGFFTCEVCRVRWPSNGYGHQAERYDDE